MHSESNRTQTPLLYGPAATLDTWGGQGGERGGEGRDGRGEGRGGEVGGKREGKTWRREEGGEGREGGVGKE